jgi:predicted dehydrogenase
MPGPLRWGVLSTARINTLLLTAAAAADDVDFVAVASRDAARARAYAERHGLERAYGSYEQLLADPDLDAVYISLPNDMHATWTQRALEAGKHVLCEKPATQSEAAARAIAAAAATAQRSVFEAFMYQHLPLMAEIRRLVAAGAIGPVQAVHCRFGFGLPTPETDHRASADREGGALADVGCYCVHAIRALAGEPERVFAEAVLGWDGVDKRCCGTMRSGDRLGTIDVSLESPTRNGLEVVGPDGAIRAEDPWHARDPKIVITRDLDADVMPVPVADPYRLELEHVAAQLRKHAFDLDAADELVRQARTMEALRSSIRTGKPVAVAGEEPEDV